MLTVSDNHIVLGGGGGGGGDVVGAASSTDNAIARFDGTTGKVVQDSNVLIADTGQLTIGDAKHTYYSKVSVKDTNAASTAIALELRGVGNVGWKGRIVAGGDTSVFIMGEYNGSAWLGAHNATLTSWSDFCINPDGGSTLFLGASTNLTRIKSAIRLESAMLLDNTGSAGTDGQVLKKVGGKVIWSNP